MRFLANENFDVLCVQDTEIYQADDPAVLEWATQQGRILLTRDVNTMVGFAYERVEAGLPRPRLGKPGQVSAASLNETRLP